MDSGWGIRTRGAREPTFNSMSCHNGSVWPRDNSLIAAGLHRYGFADAADRIASALVDAAATDHLARLPELYCGFERADGAAGDAPVAYPVSCAPQAWAAGAVQLLLRSMLGLRVDPARGVLTVAPALPPWLDAVAVRDLEVLGQRASVAVARRREGYAIETEGPIAVRPGAVVAGG